MHGLRDSTGFQNDRVDGKREEKRAKRVALLNSPCAGNNVRSRHGGASEEDAIMTITAVNPRSERREKNTNRPQHSRPVDRVERVGNVNREGNFIRIGTVATEPTGDRLASVRSLDPKLKRLQNDTRVLQDKIHANLACKTADSVAHSDTPKGTIGLAKSHDGSSANIGSPAQGSLLNEGGHTNDRGLRKRARHIDQVLGGALPMETRTRHTGQEMITIQKGIDGPDKLGASPGAMNSAMGRLTAG